LQQKFEAQEERFEAQELVFEAKFEAQNVVIADLRERISGHQENFDELNRVRSQI
jgi:hypothetical protein